MKRLSPADRSRVLKPLDSAWTVLVIDPPGLRLLARLEPMASVTPLRLTVVAQAVGLAAAVSFAAGHLVLGAALFQVRFFVDCLDGKLARLRDQTSRLGASLDANSDRIVVLASFVALAAWVGAPWLAVALAASYPISFALRDERDAIYRTLDLPRPVESASLGGLAGWLRQRRIFPTVTSIEVEHAALFVAPLLTLIGVDLVLVGLAVAALYFALQCLRFAIAVLRTAAKADRLVRGPSDVDR